MDEYAQLLGNLVTQLVVELNVKGRCERKDWVSAVYCVLDARTLSKCIEGGTALGGHNLLPPNIVPSLMNGLRSTNMC